MQKSVKFAAKYRIYYEDTDAGGVVYYANYLKFFERCRTDFLRSKGVNQKNLATTQESLFVVRKCSAEYLLPARLDDVIIVTMSVKEVRGASVILEQRAILNNMILCNFEVVIVCVSSIDFKPKKISSEIRAMFE